MRSPVFAGRKTFSALVTSVKRSASTIPGSVPAGATQKKRTARSIVIGTIIPMETTSHTLSTSRSASRISRKFRLRYRPMRSAPLTARLMRLALDGLRSAGGRATNAAGGRSASASMSGTLCLRRGAFAQPPYRAAHLAADQVLGAKVRGVVLLKPCGPTV